MSFDEIRKRFNLRLGHHHSAPAETLLPQPANDAAAFPLTGAAAGDSVRVLSFAAGKGLRRRLNDLGLPLGATIEVVHRQGSGRMVVARNHVRNALGAGMAQKIMVTRSDELAGSKRLAAE